ncbi:MAG: pitrilysin family protein [bacterium]
MKKKTIVTGLILFVFAASFVIAQTPDRSKPPTLPDPPKLNLPEPVSFELSNGLKVVLIEKHEVPLVQTNILINVGSVNETNEKSGITNLMMDWIDEGAAGKNSLQLADEIDFLGASINSVSGNHVSSISLHTPLAKYNDALKLMADIILRPDFPESELKRLQNDKLSAIMQWYDEPFAIASVGFNQLLYGKNHPYGRPSIGNENTIKSFTQKEIKDYYNNYFKSNNATIVVVGDVKKNELKEKLESAFGKWEKGNVPVVNFEKAKQVEKRTVYIIDKPESAQSVIYIGKIGEPRNTKDYYSMKVMNTVLGELFTSRLNGNLREEHGYTYGARSSFAFRKEAGPFSAYSSVQTEITDSAVIQFFVELNNISKPISAEELIKGKNYVALGYPSSFQTVSYIADQLEDKITYNLPDSYFNDFVANILKVNEKDFQSAAQKYITPEKMIVVIVGDKNKIEESIKKLNLGEVKTLTIKDVVGEIPKLIE